MEISRLPLWKGAVDSFLKLGKQPGDVISKTWLMDQFGIQEPVTAEEQKEASLDFLSCMDNFRNELLENYKIELKAVVGEGYKVVHPKEQTRLALETRTRNIANEIKKMSRSMIFVKTEMLNDLERRENTDGIAKTAMLSNMFNRRKLLGRN